jgi:hypothetical protein
VTVALSKRTRDKHAASAAKLLPPGSNIRAYVVGRGHARMATGALVAGAIFLAAFVVALLLGYVLIPGVLLLIFVIYQVRPPRSVVVSDQGLAVLGRSMWTGRPSSVVALLPLAPLSSPTPKGKVTLALGPERITLTRAEFDIAASAAAVPPPSAI